MSFPSPSKHKMHEGQVHEGQPLEVHEGQTLVVGLKWWGSIRQRRLHD